MFKNSDTPTQWPEVTTAESIILAVFYHYTFLNLLFLRMMLRHYLLSVICCLHSDFLKMFLREEVETLY